MENTQKSRTETYEFIGKLAVALYSQRIVMSLSALNTVLENNKLEPYGNCRGLGQGLTAACNYWDKKEKDEGLLPVTHNAIANVFVDRKGDSAWMNY